MSDIALLWLLFIVGYLINENICVLQLTVCSPLRWIGLDWIGCGSEYTWSLWIGLDWVSQLVDWVGLDLTKWTHVQLCWHTCHTCVSVMKLVHWLLTWRVSLHLVQQEEYCPGHLCCTKCNSPRVSGHCACHHTALLLHIVSYCWCLFAH